MAPTRIPSLILLAALFCTGPAAAQDDSDLVEDPSFLRVTVSERSWCTSDSLATAPPEWLPDRPVWLLRDPRPIAPPRDLLTKAERIEQGWWEGRNAKRDYYTAEVAGGRAWIFQDLEAGIWKLHGWWS